VRRYRQPLVRLAVLGLALVALGAVLALSGLAPAGAGRMPIAVGFFGALLVLFGGSGYVAITVFEMAE